MQFSSTNRAVAPVSFRDAVVKGLAPDGGLYMPVEIPTLPESFFRRLPEMSFTEVAFRVASAFMEDSLPERDLLQIIEGAFSFPVPVQKIQPRLHVLELFHGPTLAFKDFGARFMARLLSYFNAGKADLTILVATSGDTGSAVAHGFHGVPGIQVVVLYPSGRISRIQEMQMATLGGNIHALEVQGTFDDCQRLVKEAFLDPELSQSRRLTSANSINFARLLPQSFYYFYAWGRLGERRIVFSVPSGNYGNLTAGLLAKRMGLPVERFIAATNGNDVVPEYLRTGEFHPRPSISTISNAMDVGNPSNFARMQWLYNHDLNRIRRDVAGFAFSDEETRKAIAAVHHKTGYLLDPHGAVAYLGAGAYHSQVAGEVTAVFLETAHPAKFHEVVEAVTGNQVEIPERLRQCLEKPKLSIAMGATLDDLRTLLM